MLHQTRIMMGMPITVDIIDKWATVQDLGAVFDYLDRVDQKFSLFKDTSEISRINRGELGLSSASHDMQTVLLLSQKTRMETDGYFEIVHNGELDPTGVVKGWAVYNAAILLREQGFENFYVDAGGDIQAYGKNAQGQLWQVGIRNPFNLQQVVKVLAISDCGVATSGSYVRGSHIYNPYDPADSLADVISLTVIGPNILEADRFATAAFAMGRDGITFIEWLEGFEGYMIDRSGIATLTSGLGRYLA